jgi:hypothetical protein
MADGAGEACEQTCMSFAIMKAAQLADLHISLLLWPHLQADQCRRSMAAGVV